MNQKRVRTRANKFGYRLYRNADGSYKLTDRSGVPFFYNATLGAIDNFLQKDEVVVVKVEDVTEPPKTVVVKVEETE